MRRMFSENQIEKLIEENGTHIYKITFYVKDSEENEFNFFIYAMSKGFIKIIEGEEENMIEGIYTLLDIPSDFSLNDNYFLCYAPNTSFNLDTIIALNTNTLENASISIEEWNPIAVEFRS